MKRWRRIVGSLFVAFLVVPQARSAIVTGGTLYVSVDAAQITGLADGAPVVVWTNQGNGGVGDFATNGAPFAAAAPTYRASLAGVPAVTFTALAGQHLATWGSATTADVTGNGSYSVEAWAYNPALADHETLINWAHRGASPRYATLSFGNHGTWGAVGHWDWVDMGFDTGNPSVNAWHHLAVTFDGAIERVYVDGQLSSIEGKYLNLWQGDPFVLGASLNAGTNNVEALLSGSLGAVRLHGDALSGASVATNYFNDNGTYGQTAAVGDAHWANAGTANWNDHASWQSGTAPAGQTIVVGNGGTVVLTNDAAARMTVIENGGVQINGGNLTSSYQLVVGAGVGNAGRLEVSAGSLIRSGANWTVIGETGSTGTLAVASGASVDLQVGAFGVGAIGGAGVVSNEGAVIKRAGGVFGLGRADGATGVYVQNGAQAVTAVSNGWISIGENGTGRGTFVLNGGRLYQATSDFNIADIGASRGYYVQNGGTASVNCLLIGKNNGTGGTAGFFTLTGGQFVDRDGSGDSVVGGFGGNANTYGSVVIRGGAMEHYDNFQVGGGGLGVFEQSGGSFYHAAGYPVFGRFTTGLGVGHLTGGTFTRAANELLIVGEEGTGVVTVAGTAALTSATPMSIGHTATGVGLVNLNGGTLTVPSIYAANATATSLFNFNGGTLRPTASSATFMSGMDLAPVYAGGAVIDTDGKDITISQVLSAPAGAGIASIPVISGGTGYAGSPIVRISGGGAVVPATAFAEIDPVSGAVTNIIVTSPGMGYGMSAPTVELLGGDGSGAVLGAITYAVNVGGGLTKNGAGVLNLTGNNTYSGPTTVNGGTLLVNGAYSGGGLIGVQGGATLGGTGSVAGVTVADDAHLAPGNSAGTLMLAGALTLNERAVLDFELAAPNAATGANGSDFVQGVNGLVLDGILNVTALAGFTTDLGSQWRLIGYTGALTDQGLAIGSAPTLGSGLSYEISTDSQAVYLTVIPEPTQISLILLGAAMAVLRQLRRRR